MREGNKTWVGALGFGTVIMVGLVTFFLAIRSFPERLRAPFPRTTLPGSPSAAFGKNLLDPSSATDFLAATKDTDQDGIPDLQELKVYNTSPFLEDSDSDGALDKSEIDSGEDPTCPKGTDCRVAQFSLTPPSEQETIAKSLYEATIIPKLIQTGIPGISDGPTIRNFLQQQGLPETVLNQFTDEKLVEIFREGVISGKGTAPSTSAAPKTLSENSTAQEIRELLRSVGVEPRVLERFSDEQLEKVYKETLKGFGKAIPHAPGAQP